MDFVLQPAVGKDFVDREELLKDLISTLKNPKTRMGFALYGKRRVGKTSIFLELKRRLANEKKVVVAYLNLWDLIDSTLEEFIKALTREILQAYRTRIGLRYSAEELMTSSWNMIKNLLRELRIGVKLTDQIEFLLRFELEGNKAVDYGMLLDRVFQLAEDLAVETETRCVILLDEFPSVMELRKNGGNAGEPVIKKIRSIYERSAHIVLCVSGSVKATMDMAVFSSASAFYGQLLGKEVRPLEKKYVTLILEESLGKRLGEDIEEEIYRFTNGIPLYVHLLGKKLQLLQKTDKKTLKEVVNSFILEEATLLFKSEFTSFSSNERRVLRAINIGQVASLHHIAAYLRSTSSNISTTARRLEDKGILIRTGGGNIEMEDPVFGRWIRGYYERK